MRTLFGSCFQQLFEAMQGSGGPDGPPAPPPPPPPPPPKQRRQEPLLPQADVRQIEDYADQLYEDRMELKVYGVKCILRVCTEAPKEAFKSFRSTFCFKNINKCRCRVVCAAHELGASGGP